MYSTRFKVNRLDHRVHRVMALSTFCCSISISLLASLVAGRRPQCSAGPPQQGMYSSIPIHQNIKSAPASPGRSRAGPSLYIFSLLGLDHSVAGKSWADNAAPISCSKPNADYEGFHRVGSEEQRKFFEKKGKMSSLQNATNQMLIISNDIRQPGSPTWMSPAVRFSHRTKKRILLFFLGTLYTIWLNIPQRSAKIQDIVIYNL